MDTTGIKNRLGKKLQANQAKQQQDAGQEATADMQNETAENTGGVTALATVESGFLALTNNALEIISENLKNQPLTHGLFDVVKSPSGGITAFSVPGLTGDEIEKELTGIILDYATPRAYWETQEPKEGEPPVCYSRDSIVSFEGQPCNRCAYNDFGSKNGGETQAKACKEQVLLFLLRQDNILPLVVRVPVSSKMLFLKYTTRLVGNLTPLYGVVTKITLEKATNKTGQPYAKFNFEAVSALGQEETAAAKAFGQKLMDIISVADMNPVMPEAA